MKRLFPVLLLLAAVLPPPATAQQGTVVLDTRSPWRMFSVLKPPVISHETGVQPVSFKLAWLDRESAPAAPDWAAAELDDSGWLRGPLTWAPYTSLLSRLYLRGGFTVDNPSSVGSLTLNTSFHGGIIVYLNGVEIGRSHVPGNATGDFLAEAYPKEVFIDDAGMYVSPGRVYMDGRPFTPSKENQRRLGLWAREANIAVPAQGLRKGMNVIGIEVVRAPYDAVVNTVRLKKAFSTGDFFAPTCQVLAAQLTSQGGSGLSLGAVRPPGLHVWNADILEGDTDADFPNPGEPLRPVRIIGPRNGVFSGKIRVGSAEPITGLSAVMSELKGPGAVIPAAAVRVRYGVRAGTDRVYNGVSKAPLQQYPVAGGAARQPAAGVAPVWVAVSIPKDAAPGTYRGTLTVTASGKTMPAPVEVKVLPWTLPDAQDFRTWVDLIQSPDTLAVEYGVPLWSEKHFAMIAESFSLIRDTGSRTLYLPAISHTNLGNEQSMIRWIRKPGGGYDWDFSVMDRYLDTAKANLGMPKLVCLQVWDVYMRSAAQKRFEDFTLMGAPQVTLLDPATRKTENILLPPLSDPASKAIWQELIAKVREHLRQRGMEKALMLGMFCDIGPSKEDAAFFASVAPDLAWVQQGHSLWGKLHGVADVGYNASVWGGLGFADGCRQTNQRSAPSTSTFYGWSRPMLNALFERNTSLETYPPTRWYFFPETAITGEFRGIGRIGADLWKAVRNKDGRRTAFVHERYREGSWGGTSITLVVCNPVLSPGIEGPEATNRLVALVEGVQMCEARIYLEQAIKSGLSGDLKTRCETTLQERLFNMWRALSNLKISGWGATAWRWGPGIAGNQYFLGSGWQDQSEKIYTLAGEVRQASGR